MKKLFPAILCCVAAMHLQGQIPVAPEKEAPPTGPMLARAPDFSRWNVTTKTQSASEAASHPDAKSAKGAGIVYEYTKTGSVYLQEFTDPLGRKWSNWVSNKIAATIWPGTGAIILQCTIPGLETPNYTKSDFPGVGWVAESNFIKTTMYKGRKCLIFSQAATAAGTSRTSATQSEPRVAAAPAGKVAPAADAATQAARQMVQTALIDFDTRLPLYAQDARTTYSFEFLQPPGEMLQIPPEIDKAARQQVQVSADINRAIPHSF